MGKVLFIRGGAVGDFILTMPAIKLMRDTLPDNDIEILGYPSIAELAVVSGLADRVRSIEDGRLATFFAPGAKLDPEWCEYLSGFDLVVSYIYDPDGYFSENLKVAGVKTLIRAPFRPDESEPHVDAATQLAQPLEEIALFLEDPELQLDYPSEPGEERDRSGPLVALHPGSGSPTKNWRFESWLEVLEHLQSRFENAEFFITAGEAEREGIDDFVRLLNEADIGHTLLTEKTLAELASFYQSVDLYLGHDSGISHLAASAGAEAILLFGPSNPDVWAPATSRVRRVISPNGFPSGIQVSDVVEVLDSWTYPQPSRIE